MSNPLELDIDLLSNDEEIEIEINNVVESGTVKSYKKLLDKPTINGTELYDNYDEIDPTVPNWAKEPTKPDYTPEEVGAINADNEMSFSDIKSVWDSIFSV